jgi:predicted RND superfamily exporter protein
MLFGLGIDGIVLLYLRYLEEQQAGWTPAEATRRMAGTAASVILAQVTTATTFFALLVIDFPLLQDLGVLIGLGILFACGFTVLLLPALLARYPVTRGRRAPSAPWLGRFVVSHARRILWGSVVVTLVLGASASRLRIDTRLEKLQAKTPGTEFERDIAARFSLPQDVLLVLNDNDQLEPLIDADARLRATLAARDPAILVSGPSVLLPPSRAQDALARDLRTSGLTASEVARHLITGGREAGFRADTFAPFLDRLPRLLDPDRRVTYAGLMDHGLGSLVSRFITRRDGRYVAVTYLYPQHPIDLDALGQIVSGTDSRFRLTGLPVVNRDLARRFAPAFLRGLVLGVIAVALIIYAVFRTIRHTLLALLPTVIGFVWSAGILALLRIELDLFSLFAAVTFVGIAVDYGIYVLYRHVVERTHDMREVLTRTGAAIMIACFSALIGFGTLIGSGYGPLRLFGIVSIITLTCCMLASLLVLPAVILHTKRAFQTGGAAGLQTRRRAGA